MIKWLERKKCFSNTLTKRETRQLLKILDKWSKKEGLDVDGDSVSVYFNLLDNSVELISMCRVPVDVCALFPPELLKHIAPKIPLTEPFTPSKVKLNTNTTGIKLPWRID